MVAQQLIPEEAREKDPVLDAKAALLDQSYYQMLRLVNGLSSAAWLTNEEPFQLQDRDLVALVGDLCDRAGDLAPLLGLELRFVCAKERHICAVAPDMLEQLLYQLLSNAFKFTPAGGTVTVELKVTGKQVQISVEDTGRGIGQHRAAQESGGVTVGKGHDPGAEQTDLMDLHAVGGVKHAGHGRRGEHTGAYRLVTGFFQRAGNLPDHGIQSPGIQAFALAQGGNVAEPAIAALRIGGQVKHLGPFFQGQGHIAHALGGAGLATGEAQEQAVAGEGGHLGIGGDAVMAIGQVVAQKAGRAVVLADLGIGFMIHRRAKGIAHGKAKKQATAGLRQRRHAGSSFRFFLLL
jgi:hypothetical protein